MTKYTLTDAKHAEILKEIQARRTKTAQAGPADASNAAEGTNEGTNAVTVTAATAISTGVSAPNPSTHAGR
jgi:glucuronide carrier protein